MLTGGIYIGGEVRERGPRFTAVNPATNEVLDQAYSSANIEDVADACALAQDAFEVFSGLAPAARAAFIERVAEGILGIGDVLIDVAMSETALPRARLEGERARAIGQLRMFAQLVRRGEWLDATIDPALPQRVPPRPDLRRMNAALGPVAVFGASNFPLAFSVAGGDTASAFAAGCPVVVKGHPAHPGTGELVAGAIRKAVAAEGLPGGVFSYLPGAEHALGVALVSDPRIKAVAFTGSRAGGFALMEAARKRNEPIPVYAEMSSINPVILMPAALAKRADPLAKAFVASLTLGAGQFCTNPGLVIALADAGLDRFTAGAAEALAAVNAQAMLSRGICSAFQGAVSALDAHPAVRRVASGRASEAANYGAAALFETEASAFLGDPALAHEVFGASALIVRCKTTAEMKQVLLSLEGQLTASLHLEIDDEEAAALLLPIMREKAGRLLANGWPTGVEVIGAMVHGGPFPATSDGRTSSVGTLAVTRFLRPVCYQDMPDALLPPPLIAANPWKLTRRIDGDVVTP